MKLFELQNGKRERLIKIFIGLGALLSLCLGFLVHWVHFIESVSFGLLFLFFLTHKVKEEEVIPDSTLYLKRQDVQKQIDKITEFIKSVVKYNEVDLTKKLDSSNTIFVSLEDYINFLFSSLGEIIEWNITRAEELSLYAAQINFFTNTSKSKSEDQIGHAKQIIDLVHHLLESFQDIVSKSKKAFKITDESSANYSKGKEVLDSTVQKVNELNQYIEDMNYYLEGVKKFTHEMEKVTKMIFDMANKTNVLSLNASIEAVKAGDAGRGFKVVAQEIQKFSKVTTDASRKISDTLKQMNEEMDKSFKMVKQGKEIVSRVIDSTFSLKDNLHNFSENVEKSVNSTREISEVAAQELSQVEFINQKISEIQRAITDFKDQFNFLSKSAENITHSAENISRNVNHFEMDNFQTFAKKLMYEKTQQIAKIFEDKVEKNILSQEDIFDVNYRLILPETNPKKYHTVYDEIVDKEIQAILEELKDKLTDKAILYKKKFLACAITDKNGYAPTHLRAVCQEITGNYEKDILLSKHKKMYNDAVSLKSARNEHEFLLQVYMRDDGTQNIDLSVPLKIFGRHWGCLRAGYTFLNIEEK